MNKTKALLVLASLGLLAAVLGVGAMYWLDDGPLDPGGDPGQNQHRLDTDPAGPPDTRLAGETDLQKRETGADREQIIEGRSKTLRPVRLQFRCETLKHNVAGVWNYLQLKVDVEDEDGQHLVECVKPWLPRTLSIPVDVKRIVLVAKGYKRKVIAAPATFRKGVKPTLVFLEPDALARVRAINLPWTPGNRFGVSARLATGVDNKGQPLLYAYAFGNRKGGEALRGEITAEVKVPSGLPAMFIVRRTGRAPAETAGFASLDSQVVTLKSGEEREITVDLRDFGVLEGRVTGLAQPALKDQVLSVRTVAQKKGAANPRGSLNPRGNRMGWGKLPHPSFPNYQRGGTTNVVLDVDGHFRVTGLSKRPVSLQLRTDGGPRPALKEVGSDRRQWLAEETGFLVVEPVPLVHGVVPVKAGRFLDRPFKVQPNSPPDSRRLAKRIPLFARALLDKAPLFFFVEGIGHFNRSLVGKLPDPDGLYRVEVPVPGGSLLVHVQNQPSSGMHLFARPLALAEKVPWISITGKRTGTDWRFAGLAPGDYKLVVNYSMRRGNRGVHSGRTMPATVVVKSGQETEVTISMPELLEVLGEIVNWRDVPAALAPKWLQLQHAGRPHTARIDKNGAFKFTVMGPWEGVPEITFFSYGMLANLKTTDTTWLPAERRLSVVFPSDIRERWVSVEPIAGGRLWMHTYLAEPSTPLRRSPRRHGRHITPKKGNRFLIAEVPGGVDIMVLEQVRKDGQNLRLLRGWFRLRPGGPQELKLAPKGRFVQVSMSTASGRAKITLKPPAWWQHPPYPWAALRLVGSTPQRFWLPDDATAVLVDGKQEIPIASIGDKLVIDQP